MKKIMTVLLVICLMFLASCDFNAPLRNKMIKYYSNDENYVKLEGILVEITEHKNLRIQITTEEHEFAMYEGETVYFTVHNNEYLLQSLFVGDELVFISAPMIFYNGQEEPIIALEKGGKTYLSFEDGKASYLKWIEETFD